MKRPEIKPATEELLIKFYGKPQRTQKSLVIIEDNEPIAVAGVYPDKERFVFFSDVKPGINMKNYKRTVIACTKKLLKLTHNIPVHAVADPKVEDSEKLLKHFGFKQLDKELYSWQP